MRKFIYMLLFTFLCSCSHLEAKEEADPKPVTVTGRVYFMGSEPMTSIGLNLFNGTTIAIFAESKLLDKIAGLQNSIITVKGYIDPQIKYPMNSIHVEEFKKLVMTEITGMLHKSGMGGLSEYYLQTPDKTYNIIAEKIIEIGNFKGNMVKLNGYVFEVDDSVDNIYPVTIEKIDKDSTRR